MGPCRVKLQNPFVKKKQVLRSSFHLNNSLNVPLNLKEKYTLKFFLEKYTVSALKII